MFLKKTILFAVEELYRGITEGLATMVAQIQDGTTTIEPSSYINSTRKYLTSVLFRVNFLVKNLKG